VNAPTRRRSSRRVIPTSTSDSAPPPSTATANAPTRRRSRPQTHLPQIEKGEAQLDDSDEFDDAADDDADDLSGPFWKDRLSELVDYRYIHGNTAMFRRGTAKTPSWLRGLQPKGHNTGCIQKERHHL
jgi:hypothetical protein